MKSSENTSNTSLLTTIFEWIGSVSAALIAVTLIFTFLFRVVSVDGTSMRNTLSHGERLILSRLPYTPAYGDIVVLQLDNREGPLIKRIIGLPGDTLRIDPESGAVYRNGVVLEEPYVHAPTSVERMTGTVTVPDGQVFVMGDNRAKGCSLDSRSFGCVSMDNIMGKAVFRLLPIDRFGGIYDEP